jgi:hypothetical protein
MPPKKRQRLSISDETNQNMLKERGWTLETKNQRKTRYKPSFISGARNLGKINLLNELDYFKLFWTNDILEHTSNGTSNKLSEDGLQTVSLEEMNKYLAIELTMGFVRFPKMIQHWTESPFYGTKFISDLMGRNRWKQIHSHIDLDVNFIQEKLRQSFKNYWRPFPHLAVDEGMIPFEGRYKYKQHIFGKPRDSGIKYYNMNDEKGFVCDLWIYQGGH